MRTIITSLLMMAALGFQAQPAYLNPTLPIEQRVEDALARMTLDEKIAVIHAQSKFSSAGVPRLGFPDFWTDDGPHGVRPDVLWDEWEQAGQTNDSCVAFPALTCLAATFNPAMARLYGEISVHMPSPVPRQFADRGRSVPGPATSLHHYRESPAKAESEDFEAKRLSLPAEGVSLPLDRDDEQRHTSPGAAGVHEGAAPHVLKKSALQGAGGGRVFAIGPRRRAKTY